MLILASVNLYGFFKCSKEQQNKLSKLGTKVASNMVKEGLKKFHNILELNNII